MKNRALRRALNARSDHWESQYLCGRDMKRQAKRTYKRASRRAAKFDIRVVLDAG